MNVHFIKKTDYFGRRDWMVKTTVCTEHGDCFANQGGRCACLKDNDFGGRDCPFYKPADTVRKENRGQDGGVF